MLLADDYGFIEKHVVRRPYGKVPECLSCPARFAFRGDRLDLASRVSEDGLSPHSVVPLIEWI